MLIRVRFVFFEVIDTMRRQILRGGLKLVVAYSVKRRYKLERNTRKNLESAEILHNFAVSKGQKNIKIKNKNSINNLKIYDYDNKHRTRLRRISSQVIDKQSIDTNTKRLPNQREVFSFVINPCSLLLRGP
jgi:hypothetical protein